MTTQSMGVGLLGVLVGGFLYSVGGWRSVLIASALWAVLFVMLAIATQPTPPRRR